jgi:membrane-bound lytic murein transglycosylase A
MRRGARVGARRGLGALGAGALVAACQPPPPRGELALQPVEFAALPDWTRDAQAAALVALRRSCGRIATLPEDRPLGPETFGKAGDWRAPCQALEAVDGSDVAVRATLERLFRPFAALDGDSAEGLFTGYYEPELRGSRNPSARNATPLHALPRDLVTVDLGSFRDNLRGERIVGRIENGALRPYPDRAAIDGGALGDAAWVLVWVDDPVDAFFLHIQGSGRVVLDEGGVLRLGYAAQNGHAYVPIGRVLVERGELRREQVSMQSIRAWLAANPTERRALLHRNPSYVFFRVLEGEGPIGSEGVALTPGRSIAVDRRVIALGVPIWLDAEDPLEPSRRVRRLLVAQDTGGAIRGVVRGDVFWGAGADAAERAGRMRSQGRWWILLPNALADRLENRH